MFILLFLFYNMNKLAIAKSGGGYKGFFIQGGIFVLARGFLG